jgi:hypothetical protein
MGTALIELRRFDDAVAAATKALRKNQTFSTIYRCLASALAHLGRDADAKMAAARLLELYPDYRISDGVALTSSWGNKLYIDGGKTKIVFQGQECTFDPTRTSDLRNLDLLFKSAGATSSDNKRSEANG